MNPRPLNHYAHESDTPLAIALKKGHRETAELLASADGMDPCARIEPPSPDETGIFSILLLAIHNGHETAALTLLNKYDLGHEDQGSSNRGFHDKAVMDVAEPVSLAAKREFLEVFKMLISDAGVEFDHKEGEGRTALSHAAGHAHKAVVAELLKMGAVDPDSKDNTARTPLIWDVGLTNGYGRDEWSWSKGY